MTEGFVPPPYPYDRLDGLKAKADVAPDAKRLTDLHPGSVTISAATGEGLDALLLAIGDRLRALAARHRR